MIAPILAIYNIIKKNILKVSEEIDKKSRYVNIIASVILYVIFSFSQVHFITETTMPGYTYRGIITQLQMIISIYLVLTTNKTGYMASVLMNTVNILSTVAYMIRFNSIMPLPGTISYISVLIIITLIIAYKNKTTIYVDRINSQKKSIEDSEKKLYQLAYFDSLTGLPNRDLFVKQLNRSIHVARRNACLIGVMYVDLDSFKTINDIAGHATGDLVLNQMSSRISSCLRTEDTISRFGGDEFLIKIDNIKNFEDFHIISNRVLDVFKKPIIVQNYEYFVTASIGVAVYPMDGEDSETLIKNADIAMYSAKNKGKNQCIFCTSDIKEDIVKKMKLTNSLYRAIDKNELLLYYQPLIDVKTNEIIGLEALLRWNNDEYGIISPGVFIPIAEQTGLIRPIGLWVIRTACEQLKRFRINYNNALTISINLSLTQLKEFNIVNDIRKIFDITETNAKNVNFEITESTAFSEESDILQQLQDIKKLGSSIHIDDFGAGYSSFRRLSTFPIDLIKIDMEFVRAISSKLQKDRAVIKSIIQMSKNLGMEVLAEGVETEEQFMFLKENGCDKIQGYYFYKPMTTREIETILQGHDGPVISC